MPRKILSYIITTNGVKPLTPKEGVTTKTPKLTPPPKGGEGVMPSIISVMEIARVR